MTTSPSPPSPPNHQRRKSSLSTTSSTTSISLHPNPSVMDDDGLPTQSLVHDLKRVLSLIADERHLVAYELFLSVKGRCEEGRRVVVEDEGMGEKEGKEEEKEKKRVGWIPILRGFVGGNRAAEEEEEEFDAEEDLKMAKRILKKQKEEFKSLEKRAQLFHQAKQNITKDDGWIRAQTLFGITTYYRHEKKSSSSTSTTASSTSSSSSSPTSLSIKLEGDMSGLPLFEQLAVLREADLYHKWAPFCTSSRKLAQLGKVDTVSWMMVGLPLFGLSRDACVRAIGCDCMREDGSILLVGKGLGDRKEDGVKRFMGGGSERSIAGEGRERERRRVRRKRGGRKRESRSESPVSTPRHEEKERRRPSLGDKSSSQSSCASLYSSSSEHTSSYLSRDSILSTIELPPVPTKYGHNRMTIKSFQAVIDVLSPTTARTRVVANIDPNLRFIPQTLIDWVMKKLCGVLLNRLQHAAKNILKDPVRNPHARRMREDAQFYRNWLLPKFERYCDELGWKLPPVKAFEVTEEEMDEEEWMLYNQIREGGMFVGKNEDDQQDLDDAQSVKTILSAPIETKKSSNSSIPSSSNSVASTLPAPSPGTTLFAFEKQRARQRVDERQARKIASSRKKAALRLKPTPFQEEQKDRLKRLHEAKRRIKEREEMEKLQNSDKKMTCSRGLDIDVGINKKKKKKRSLQSRNSSPFHNKVSNLVLILTGTHPTTPPAKMLVPLLLMMTFLYSVDYSTFVYSRILDFYDNPLSKEHVIMVLFKDSLCLLLLVVYGIIHWGVLCGLLVLAFDSLEIPGSEEFAEDVKGKKKKSNVGLKVTRKLYTDMVRKYTGYISSVSILFSFVTAIGVEFTKGLIYYSNRIFTITTTWLDQHHHSFYLHLMSASLVVSSAVSTVLTWLLRITSSVLRVGALPFNWFFRVFPVVSTLLKGVRSVILRVSSIFYKLMTVRILQSNDKSISVDTWRKYALDTAGQNMSYSSVFLLLLILFACIIFPKKSAPAPHNGQTKQGEMLDMGGLSIDSSSSPTGESEESINGGLSGSGSGSMDADSYERRDLKHLVSKEEAILEEKEEEDEDEVEEKSSESSEDGRKVKVKQNVEQSKQPSKNSTPTSRQRSPLLPKLRRRKKNRSMRNFFVGFDRKKGKAKKEMREDKETAM